MRQTGQIRLALGTAQLGTEYGVANRTGQPARGTGLAMLERALEGGIRWFDTAQGYGTAEGLLGEILRGHQEAEVAVVTKLDPAVDPRDEDAVRRAVEASCEVLGRPPTAMLVHEPAQLPEWDGVLGRTLRRCQEEGLTRAIGVSVYQPDEFAQALELRGLTIVQAPYSILDRRLELAGLIDAARSKGIQPMLRSVFLQGLLLLGRDRRPPWLRCAGHRLDEWQKLCADYGIDRATVALRFVLDRIPGAVVAVGCETLEQLEAILGAADRAALPADLTRGLECLATDDLRLIDPTRWPGTR